ncbi:V-type ATP synthase subunit I domain-containing protein [Streptococcus anginosus]|uniref:Uncharacterized protein n=1 Tax=Streptococcus anginosus TaxID=1328 RepID=A0ABD4U1N0_STRAP|nr:hypothetical protein [Streptococcus anginosus]MCW1076512.1 hypothetical protein [Streptococcus anginosus]
MKNIEEKILMADEEIKQLQNKRKKLISQQKQEERKKRDKRIKKGQSLKVFSDLLNYELFKRGKRELVDVKQLITIDYIFLFYPKYYLELKDFGMLLLDEDIEEIRLVETMHSSQNRKKDIKDISLLTKESNEMLHNQEKLSSEKYKPYIYFLITRTFDGYKEKEDDVKHLIDELPDNEFIQYWELMRMIRGNTIYTNSLDFDTGNRKNYYEIYELNRERFKSIADRKGIIFKVDTQTV